MTFFLNENVFYILMQIQKHNIAEGIVCFLKNNMENCIYLYVHLCTEKTFIHLFSLKYACLQYSVELVI